MFDKKFTKDAVAMFSQSLRTIMNQNEDGSFSLDQKGFARLPVGERRSIVATLEGTSAITPPRVDGEPIIVESITNLDLQTQQCMKKQSNGKYVLDNAALSKLPATTRLRVLRALEPQPA